MVSFELGKEIEKDVLCLQLSRDWDKEKILGSHGIRFLMGTQKTTRRKTSYSMQPPVIKNYEVTLKHAN